MSVTLSTPGLDELASQSAHKRRQTEYAMRAAFVMRQYVPVDEGTLRASEQLSSQYSEGLLRWTTPYALTQYEVPMRHTAAGTCDHWDEACWKAHGKDLIAYAETLYEGY